MEVLQNIWNHLTENQLTNSPFDVWMENILSDTNIQNNVYNYLSENGMTSSDFDTWSLNAGLKKKEVTQSGLESGNLDSTLQNDIQIQTGEDDTAIERTFGKNFLTDFLGDIYRAGEQGVAQGATLDDAMKLFSQGKEISDEDLQEYIRVVQEMESYSPSDEMKDFDKIYQKEWRAIKPLIIREIATILVQGEEAAAETEAADSAVETEAAAGAAKPNTESDITIDKKLFMSYNQYIQKIMEPINETNKESGDLNGETGMDKNDKFQTIDINKEKLKKLSNKIETIEAELIKIGKKGRPSKRENPFI